MKNKLLPLLGALLLITNANAALSYSFNLLGSGTVLPTGSAPWLTASINEVDSDTVTLTVTSSLNNPAEFFTGIGFQLTDSFVYGSLTTSGYTQTGAFDQPTVTIGSDVAKGYGNIRYDVWFDFNTSSSDGGAHRFNGSDFFTYTIDGININDVDITNNAGVAHVQGLIGADGIQTSSWILPTTVNTSQVPEASSALLGCVGALALLRRRR
jgi:hypothetical protein